MIKLTPLAVALREVDAEVQDLRQHNEIADVAEEMNLLVNILFERIEKIERILEDNDDQS